MDYNEDYENEEPQLPEEESDNGNKPKSAMNRAADAAIASRNPYAMAAGAAAKTVDRVREGVRNKNKRPLPGNSGASNQNETDGNGGEAPKQNGGGITSVMALNNDDSKESVAIKIMKNPMTIKIALVLIPVVIGLLFIVYIIMVITGYEGMDGMAIDGYYNIQCKEMTVIFTDKDNGYAITGTGTYDLETYVAGVIAGEVGFFGNLEVDKAFAIAARSYALSRESNCTIESSDRYQVFREPTAGGTDDLAIQAANETKGQVLLRNNQLFSTQYDAFACIDKDENYYTVAQGEQKIPISWVESKINPQSVPHWFICNGRENLQNHHGNGMSQYGSLYLAEELEYDFKQILNSYLGDEVTISRKGFIGNIDNLEIKTTLDSKPLSGTGIRLDQFLSSNGSSMEELNDYVRSSVEYQGVGTRAGVVAAGVSLINFLYDGYKVRIPYWYGGKYQKIGVDPTIGAYDPSMMTPNGNVYYYRGFDCSGFVSWALRNGGYMVEYRTTNRIFNKYGTDYCNVNDSSCIGQPGDLIDSPRCHVQLIVHTDEARGKYIIAESTGKYGVIMREWGMHQGHCGGAETYILHMDDFYENSANVDPNY